MYEYQIDWKYVRGRITHTGANPDFTVSDIPAVVEPTGLKVFEVTMRMAPAVNESFTLFQADSPTEKRVLPWGAHVG